MATSKPTAPQKPTATKPTAPQKPGPKAPTAPAKPAAPAPKAAPQKPAAAPQKPAVAAPAKPAPKAPVAAAAPSKPVAASAPAKAAPPKPGPQKPASAPAAAPQKAAPDNEAVFKEIMTTFEAVNARLTALEVATARLSSYAFPATTLDDDGSIVLDIENAETQDLANWFYQMGYSTEGLTTEGMRKHMLDMRAAGQPFEFVNEIPEGGAPFEGSDEEAAAEPEAEETIEVSEEDLAKMNWSALTELAGRLGVDFSDIAKPPQPKVLRGRLTEAMAAGGSEAPEADENGFYEGAPILVTFEGEGYPATFVGYSDTEGEIVVEWPEADAEGNTRVSIDASIVSLAEG